MWQTIKENLVRPAAARLGTAAGVSAVGWGLQHEQAVQIEAVVIGLVLLLGDLILDAIHRKTFRQKVLRGEA